MEGSGKECLDHGYGVAGGDVTPRGIRTHRHQLLMHLAPRRMTPQWSALGECTLRHCHCPANDIPCCQDTRAVGWLFGSVQHTTAPSETATAMHRPHPKSVRILFGTIFIRLQSTD